MKQQTVYVIASILGLAFGVTLLSAQGRSDLGVAEYTDAGDLVYPDNVESWIVMGASLGADYNGAVFDPQNPGAFGVVQMEPSAYRYFVENREYADGTMFLLTFFAAESNSDPQLAGFVQGDPRGREIHVIDGDRFVEGRGFFPFREPGGSAGKIPDGSECVRCHTAEGDFDATFIQFYPTIRNLL